MTSYLENRYQAVWIDHTLSSFLYCDAGVPQGSILGPLLFLTYFNDLLEYLEGSVDSYADDTTITAVGGSLNEIEIKLEHDCEKASTWLKSNKLKLNAEKTHLLTLGTQKRLSLLSRKLEIRMENVALKESPQGYESLLGCCIDTSLKWNSQVKMLIQKLVKRLNSLVILQKICSFDMRKKLAEGLFNSTLIYCLPLFGGMNKNLCNQIQTINNENT